MHKVGFVFSIPLKNASIKKSQCFTAPALSMNSSRPRKSNEPRNNGETSSGNTGRRLRRQPDFNLFDQGANETVSDDLSDRNYFARYTTDKDDSQFAVDRKAAENAFDAVDKLFGEMKRNGDMDRKKWLNDIKARAATSEEGGDHSYAVDVHATKTEDDAEDDSQKSSFEKLMKFARRGPNSHGSSRRRNAQNQKSTREIPTTRRSDSSNLLTLTKNGPKSKGDRSAPDEDDYEPLDDEMEKTIVFRGSTKAQSHSRGRRRQKFSAVRRIGTNRRRIQERPADWEPLRLEDIEKYRSDPRALAGGQRKREGNGVVEDCKSCEGTGLEPCIACLGAGWIPALSKIPQDARRYPMLEDIWSKPNLVVDLEGEAQCVYCNGIGKQICRSCLGSGSATRKGFSLSDRYEVFDMFPEVKGESILKDEEFEDEDENLEEMETFQLYQGSGQTFQFNDHVEDIANDIKVVPGDLEEDEASDLLESLDISELKEDESNDRNGTSPDLHLEEDQEDDIEVEMETSIDEEVEEDDGFVSVNVRMDDDIDDDEDEIDDEDDDMDMLIEDAFNAVDSDSSDDVVDESIHGVHGDDSSLRRSDEDTRSRDLFYPDEI